MLITKELLYAYNGINQNEDEASQELLDVHIGSAQQIINDYVGFDTNIVVSSNNYSDAQIAMFKNVALRITTLLQLEDNANIGVSINQEIGATRSYLNVVDYTPYLRPLSTFRQNTGM